eukprot:gene11577-12967_t
MLAIINFPSSVWLFLFGVFLLPNIIGVLSFLPSTTRRHIYHHLSPPLFLTSENEQVLGLLYNDFVLSITSNATIAKYDVTRNTIIKEGLVYKARSSKVDLQIVELMQERQNENLSDKQFNSLICLPAAPGSGKSTFMARFPETTGFKNYVQNRSSMPCVVIPITFNSRMNEFLNDADTIGLRMLYAAAISMSDKEEYSQHTWTGFCEMFQEFASLKARRALYILRRVYGDRRMLLLVDELSKAKDGLKVMSEIGVILDGERTVDVLVSSLSPTYIVNLLTGSQRPVEYVVLPPLIEEKLGRKETKIWATKVMKNIEKEKQKKQQQVVPPFLSRMVSSVYLFASGHPRSIEKLLRSLDKDLEEWKNEIKPPRLSILSKMYNLADLAEVKMTIKAPAFSETITVPFILEEVLSHKTYTTLTPKLRVAVENGFIYLGQRSDLYSPNIRLGSLFRLLRGLPASPPPYYPNTTEEPPGPNTQLALRVLEDNLNPNSTKGHLSTLFERCIAFNILVRQKDRFGVVDLTMDEYNSTWTFRRCEADEDLLVVKMNEVVLPFRNDQSGFDLRACCDISSGLNTEDPKEAEHIYIQIKSGSSKKKNRADVVAKAVLNIIQAHMKLTKSWEVAVADVLEDKNNKWKLQMSKLHVIFYDWGCREKPTRSKAGGWPTKEALLQAFESLVVDIMQEKSPSQKASLTTEEIEATRTFLNETYHSNLHVVGKETMDKWLLPTLAVIPRLVEEVDEEED